MLSQLNRKEMSQIMSSENVFLLWLCANCGKKEMLELLSRCPTFLHFSFIYEFIFGFLLCTSVVI